MTHEGSGTSRSLSVRGI